MANIFIFLPSTLLYYAVYFPWTNCFLIIRIIHLYSFIYLQYLYVDYFYKWCTLGKIINKSIFLDWFMFLIYFFFCSKHWNVDIRKIHYYYRYLVSFVEGCRPKNLCEHNITDHSSVLYWSLIIWVIGFDNRLRQKSLIMYWNNGACILRGQGNV